jgi:hypothetical protein
MQLGLVGLVEFAAMVVALTWIGVRIFENEFRKTQAQACRIRRAK